MRTSRLEGSLLAAITVGSLLALTAADYTGPEMPRVIVGRVMDGVGQPVADAVIEWGPETAAAAERETVRTGADGRYRLETRKVGVDYRLGVSGAGCRPWWQNDVIPGPASAPSVIDVQLRPGTDWTIKAVDGAGKPVTGASVVPMTPTAIQDFQFRFGPPPPSRTFYPGASRAVPLNAEGVAVLRDLFPQPQIRIEADGPLTPEQTAAIRGRAEQSEWLYLRFEVDGRSVHDASVTQKQAHESREITVVFPDDRLPRYDDRQTGVIRGRVVDQATRQPVTNAVVVRRYDVAPLAVDAEGRFELGPKLTNGRDYEFRVFAAGYAVCTKRLIALAPDETVEVDLELTPHPSLEGRLVEAASGQPLAGVEIVTGFAKPQGFNYVEWSGLDSYADGHHSLTNVLRVKTDAAGRFIIPEAPGAAAALIVLVKGYARRIIPPNQRPAADANGLVTFALQPESTLTIVADRDTVLGSQADSIWVSYPSTDGFEHMYHSIPLDADGRVVLDRLPAGEYSIGLFKYSGQVGFSILSHQILLGSGERREETLGKLPGELAISGWAPPLADVHIQAQPRKVDGALRNPPLDRPLECTVAADVDGRFELRGLPPGTYQLGPRDREWGGHLIETKTIELQADAQVILRSLR